MTRDKVGKIKWEKVENFAEYPLENSSDQSDLTSMGSITTSNIQEFDFKSVLLFL